MEVPSTSLGPGHSPHSSVGPLSVLDIRCSAAITGAIASLKLSELSTSPLILHHPFVLLTDLGFFAQKWPPTCCVNECIYNRVGCLQQNVVYLASLGSEIKHVSYQVT